jgi:hypothetical protein
VRITFIFTPSLSPPHPGTFVTSMLNDACDLLDIPILLYSHVFFFFLSSLRLAFASISLTLVILIVIGKEERKNIMNNTKKKTEAEISD